MLDVINDIEQIRSGNNKNWMDLLRLAYKHAPEETKEILLQICDNDRKITDLLRTI